MRIRTILRLNNGFILATAGLFVLALVWAFRETITANENESLVANMQSIAYQRTELRDEYLFRHEERAKGQWTEKTEQFKQMIALAGVRFAGIADQSILPDIQREFYANMFRFSELVEYRKKMKDAASPQGDIGERRLISQIIVNAYDLNGSIDKLHKTTQAAADLARNKTAIIIIVLFIITAAISFGNSAFINGIVTRRMRDLHKGAAVLGAGNLDYRIPISGNDEFTDLAKTTNEMAEKLNHSYTSVENLQAEIAERVRVEEERAQLTAALATKNTELEQLVYVASHDLRSPLVNIDGYGRELAAAIEDLRRTLAGVPAAAEILPLVAPLLEADIPEALRFIRSSTSKMDALLKGLLRLSRSSRAALTIESLDMNELISNVVDSFEFQIREAGVALEVGDLPPCRSDALQVNQVFSNLLSNALKYLDAQRPGVIRISGRTEGKRSMYCVEDNGIGIAPEHLDKIFELFHRLDPKLCEGEGLGLTIVKQILDRLEGTIRVESDIGLGSRFSVALPTYLMKNEAS
ncbi:MAG: sensor histidine kinase [Syntrophales bacterium]